jgi:hypothetical protein
VADGGTKRTGRKAIDQALALALATGTEIRSAARNIGISERTAFRRLTDPRFREMVSKFRGELVMAAAGKLSGGLLKAAGVLVELLNEPSPTIRLGASKTLFELSVKLTETVEFEERLRRLESRELQCLPSKPALNGLNVRPPDPGRE